MTAYKLIAYFIVSPPGGTRQMQRLRLNQVIRALMSVVLLLALAGGVTGCTAILPTKRVYIKRESRIVPEKSVSDPETKRDATSRKRAAPEKSYRP